MRNDFSIKTALAARLLFLFAILFLPTLAATNTSYWSPVTNTAAPKSQLTATPVHRTTAPTTLKTTTPKKSGKSSQATTPELSCMGVENAESYNHDDQVCSCNNNLYYPTMVGGACTYSKPPSSPTHVTRSTEEAFSCMGVENPEYYNHDHQICSCNNQLYYPTMAGGACTYSVPPASPTHVTTSTAMEFSCMGVENPESYNHNDLLCSCNNELYYPTMAGGACTYTSAPASPTFPTTSTASTRKGKNKMTTCMGMAGQSVATCFA